MLARLKQVTGWLAALAFGLAAALVAVQTADRTPEWPAPDHLYDWLRVPPNPWLLLGLLISAIGAIGSYRQLFGPQPATVPEVAKVVGDVVDTVMPTLVATDHGVAATQAKVDALAATSTASFARLEARLGAAALASVLGDIRDGKVTRDDLVVLIDAAMAQAPPDASAAIVARYADTIAALAQSPDPALRAVAVSEVSDRPDGYRALMALGEEAAATSAAAAATAAARFREAGALAALHNVADAIAAWRRAADLESGDFWTWIELARLHAVAGSLDAVRAALAGAEQAVGGNADAMVLHNERGDVASDAGDVAEARRQYEAGLAIAARLAADDPGNPGRQRDLSVSHNKLGDVARAAGDLAEARRQFDASLAIAARLAAADPGNAGLQRDLAVSHNKLGDVARDAGDIAEARRQYEAEIAIAVRLAAADPGNAGWQRDLAVSHERLGDVARDAGDLTEARRQFDAGLAIRARLAAADPGNAGWQRDLSVSHDRLGEVAALAGDRPAAIRCYEASLSIAAALARAWPDHPGFARDLATTEARLAALRRD